MSSKEHLLFPLFEQFLRDMIKGKRTKANGERIKPQTVNTYKCVYRLLTAFCIKKKLTWRVYEYNRLNKREKLREKRYWSKFESQFTSYMHNERNNYDNYTGYTYKQLKTFFHYLNRERMIDTGPYFKLFKVVKQPIPVTALTHEQLIRLIYSKELNAVLPWHLQRTKDMFVFGSACALRFSDLMLLTPMNIELVNGNWYLKTITKKTQSIQSIKLPEYSVAILQKYLSPKNRYLFPRISLFNFNAQLKRIGETMGLVHLIFKHRSKRGIINLKRPNLVRFCDTMSSHLMRRTGITNMLTLGMPENLVKYVSGHTGDSKSFHRYVAYSQTYITNELDKIYEQMKSKEQ